MLAVTPDRLGSIQRASRALLVFFIFVTVISLWATLNNVVHPYPAGTRTLAGVTFQGSAITGKVHGLWLTELLLGAVLTLKILYHLIRLMILYSRRELFTAASVAHTRHIGFTYAGGLALWLIVLIGAAPEILATQEQWLNIMPSFPGGAILGCCAFLFASRVLDEGRELREEQDLVV
jgi:hypothetical protein